MTPLTRIIRSELKIENAPLNILVFGEVPSLPPHSLWNGPRPPIDQPIDVVMRIGGGGDLKEEARRFASYYHLPLIEAESVDQLLVEDLNR
jgi:hypothetical protein